VRASDVRALVSEAKSLGLLLREEVETERVGPVLVSGVLAEQLAKELAAGAHPGTVLVRGEASIAGAEVLVLVVAGDPTPADEALVGDASRYDIDVVIVELWPQADWTRPFVLAPFVVECRAGEGFPIAEIAARIVEASEHSTVLASRIPTLAEATRSSLVRSAVVRSAVIGLAGSRLGVSRTMLSREQVTLTTRLRATSGVSRLPDELPALAGGVALAMASGFALRSLARGVRPVVPTPIANAVVAAAGTWALAKAVGAVEARLPSA
jgi:hypothetical protein